MSFFTGFGVSALVYFVLNQIFPVPGKSSHFEEVDVSGFLDNLNHRDLNDGASSRSSGVESKSSKLKDVAHSSAHPVA